MGWADVSKRIQATIKYATIRGKKAAGNLSLALLSGPAISKKGLLLRSGVGLGAAGGAHLMMAGEDKRDADLAARVLASRSEGGDTNLYTAALAGGIGGAGLGALLSDDKKAATRNALILAILGAGASAGASHLVSNQRGAKTSFGNSLTDDELSSLAAGSNSIGHGANVITGGLLGALSPAAAIGHGAATHYLAGNSAVLRQKAEAEIEARNKQKDAAGLSPVLAYGLAGAGVGAAAGAMTGEEGTRAKRALLMAALGGSVGAASGAMFG